MNYPPAVFYGELRQLIIDFDKENRNQPKTRGESIKFFMEFAAERFNTNQRNIMTEKTQEHLSLKWGTVKGWSNLSKSSQEILQEYFAEGQPMSCMADKPDAARKQVLCKLIDGIEGEIWNDWDGKLMTKEEAKEYVTGYGS